MSNEVSREGRGNDECDRVRPEETPGPPNRGSVNPINRPSMAPRLKRSLSVWCSGATKIESRAPAWPFINLRRQDMANPAILNSLSRLSRPSPFFNLRVSVRRPLLLPSLAFLLAAVALGLIPRDQTPDWLRKTNDKVLHFSSFLVLGILGVLVWEMEDLSPSTEDRNLAAKMFKAVLRSKVGLTCVALGLFAWVSEVAQEMLSPVGPRLRTAPFPY